MTKWVKIRIYNNGVVDNLYNSSVMDVSITAFSAFVIFTKIFF
jgi:hypothetical protein